MSDEDALWPTVEELASAGGAAVPQYYVNRFLAHIVDGEAVIAFGSRTPFSPETNFHCRVVLIEPMLRSLHKGLGDMIAEYDRQAAAARK